MKGRVTGRLTTAVAIAALVAGACSLSGSSGSSPPIVMATVSPLTGQYASYGIPTFEGALAAQKVINDNGGINGSKLQIDGVDDVSDAADAVIAINQEIALHKPVALVGIDGFAINALQPIFDGHHIVGSFLGGSTSYDTITDPLLYRCNPSDSQLSVAMAVVAKEKGYATAVSMNTTVNASQYASLQNAFEALGGKFLGTIPLVNGSVSYRSEVQRAVNMHPDVIFLSLDPTSASILFSNFRQLNNLAIPFIGTDGLGQPAFIKAVGPSVAKAHMISVQGSNALSSSGAQFAEAYQQANGHGPLTNGAYAFDCTIAFALAIAHAGNSDPNKWVSHILEVTNPPGTQVFDFKTAIAAIKAGTKINYEGVSGPMDFNKNHNVAGPWDVVQASGNSDNGTTVLETLGADKIQQVITLEGG
jgi:branched-chain amino acid transport system substrate-binding protein